MPFYKLTQNALLLNATFIGSLHLRAILRLEYNYGLVARRKFQVLLLEHPFSGSCKLDISSKVAPFTGFRQILGLEYLCAPKIEVEFYFVN